MIKIINQELGIAYCNLKDLTIEQVSGFLGQWEENAQIGQLTLFYDEKTSLIVLNKDNEEYDKLLKITEDYLKSDEESRHKFRINAPGGIKETIQVLDKCVKHRAVKKEMFMVKNNVVNNTENMAVLKEIVRSECDKALIAILAFLYGEMCGKRKERAKKRKQQGGARNEPIYIKRNI